VTSPIGASEVESLRDCMAGGGVAVFPTDTVYGVCCDPDSEAAARRMYELKGRPAARPAAIMFFDLDRALVALPELQDAERAALSALLPGPVTVLLANRARRFAAACRADPATLGLRVPWLPDGLAALGAMPAPVMQSSANISGERDATTLAEVPARLRDGAGLVLDGGELPGRPSTVVDLRDYASEGSCHVLREGALSAGAIKAALARVR
jgi:L-threonylcarbamoyladenylate synthase